MKKLIILLLIIAGNAGAGFTQGIDFFHGSWAEALQRAKTEQKLIFVDAYASWCGPCKRMAKDVFPDPKAGAFYNANFVCMKIDMEKPENAEFASKYPVRSYPTLMFIDAEGKVALKDVGAKQVDALIELGRKALGAMDNIEAMEEAYTGGQRDPQFMLDYVRALNRAGKPSLKFTNEYLNTQQDLGTEFNRRFILEGLTEADSRVFDLLVQQQKEIAALAGAEAVDARIEAACRKTVQKAVEFRSEELLAEARNKMKAARPDRAAAFAFEADMRYYAATEDSKRYLKSATGFQKAIVKNNAARLHGLSQDMLRAFTNDTKVLQQATKYAEMAAKTGGLPEYYLSLADLYYRLGRKDDALKAAREGLQVMGDQNNSARFSLENFIRQLEGGTKP